MGAGVSEIPYAAPAARRSMETSNSMPDACAVPHRVLRRSLGLLGAVALSFSAYWAMRLAYAEHLSDSNSSADRSRAIRLAPSDARLYIRWGRLDTKRRVPALEAALARNPRDSSAWIELGLRAEAQGDFRRAEQCLLEAARVDRTLAPRWSLANFYFRRDNTEEFWRWARQAAAMFYGDPAPLFRLCWKVAADPNLILTRVLPDREQILRQYLGFLLGENRLEAAEPVAERVLKEGTPESFQTVLNYCDRLLEAGLLEPAVRMWNSLASRNPIRCSALDPERGVVATNGDFAAPPLSRGFDWRIPEVHGVRAARIESPFAMRFSFSGKQPESCEILSQYLAVLPGRTYRMSFRCRTSGIPPESGLRWKICGAESPQLSSEDWKEQELEFRTPPNAGPVRLTLGYQRAPGTTRIEGSIWLSAVKVAATW
jgi:tetratricopeptide (TPR) repeat protein